MEVWCWGEEAGAITHTQGTRWTWCQGKKMMFCHRLKICSLLQKLVDEGAMPAEAIFVIKNACSASLSVTQFCEAIRSLPNFPNIQNLCLCTISDVNLRLRGHLLQQEDVLVAVWGSCICSANSAQDGPHLWSCWCSKTGCAGSLSGRTESTTWGDGPGGPDHVMFQGNGVRATI